MQRYGEAEIIAYFKDYSKDRYGKSKLNQSTERTGVHRSKIEDISSKDHGKSITMRARVHTTRLQGNKMCFLALRQQTALIQGLVQVHPEEVSKQMVKWSGGISLESIVVVSGKIMKTDSPIYSATCQEAEIHINKIHLIAEAESHLPIQLDDASRSDADAEKSGLATVNLDTKLNFRVIDLRTLANQAIFKIQAAVCSLFREYLDQRSFTEIHTPKLMAAATESGASVFKVTYFGRDAFLAQSPQLAKQMCIAADFERVYEIAPVFRAEDSNTPRHMTEFMGLDLEMAFEEHYHEVLDLLEQMFLFILSEIKIRYGKEIEIIRRQYPVEEFMLPQDGKVPRLHFSEGIAMLREAGREVGDYEDLG